jgi:ferric-dicitrate binding protein FerR (iron transport regulator)
MRGQEPEQEQAFGQTWQTDQEHRAFGAEYPARYEPDQQAVGDGSARASAQDQPISVQMRRVPRVNALGLTTIIVAAIGFFLAVAGIVVSALVLQSARGQESRLALGGIGLGGSIVVLLVCVALFVIAVVALALRARRGPAMRARGRRWRRRGW